MRGTSFRRGDFLPQGSCTSFFFVVFVGFRYCRGTSSGDFFPLGTFSLRGVFPSGDFLPQGFCIIFFSVYKLISLFFVGFRRFSLLPGDVLWGLFPSGDFFPLGTFSLRGVFPSGDFLPQGFCIIFFSVYKLISFFFVFRRFSSVFVGFVIAGGRPLGTFSLWGLSPSGDFFPLGTFSLRAFALFSLVCTNLFHSFSLVFVGFRPVFVGEFFPLGTFSLRAFACTNLFHSFSSVFVGFRYCRGTSSGDFFPLGTFSLRGVFPSGDFLPQGFCIIFFSVYKLISLFFVGFRRFSSASLLPGDVLWGLFPSGDFLPQGTFSLRAFSLWGLSPSGLLHYFL